MKFASIASSYRAQLALLGAIAMLIILMPWGVEHVLLHRAEQANQRVAEAERVVRLLYKLRADLRDYDSAVLLVSIEIDLPLLPERLALAGQFDSQIDELVSLMKSSPDQLLVLGSLQSKIRQRVLYGGLIAQTHVPEERLRLINAMVGMSPLRPDMDRIQDQHVKRLQDYRAYSNLQAARHRWVNSIALGLQLGLLAVVMAILFRQVSRLLHAEQDRQRASDQAITVVRTVREPIVLVDHALTIVMRNPAFDQLYGLENVPDIPPEPLNLCSLGDGVWMDSVLRQRLMDVIARDRDLWDHLVEHVDAEGGRRFLLVNAQRVLMPGQAEPIGLITLGDVTLQHTVVRQVEELNRQLTGKMEQVTQVNEELEAFSYSVSHDLRAPLRHIDGFAGKLERHIAGELDGKGRHYLDVIRHSARRMSTLIDDLLMYSRLGRGALRLQSVDMQGLVEQTRALLDANLRTEIDDGATSDREVQWLIGPLPVVLADENMMRQLWINLLGNAIKYTAGCNPTVIQVDCQRQNTGDYHFRVHDNGSGFDMQHAAKLFGVFQRLHKATEFSGNGVGLASCRRVLSRHNGRIWAEAQPGIGAIFHFTLPIHPDGERSEIHG